MLSLAGNYETETAVRLYSLYLVGLLTLNILVTVNARWVEFGDRETAGEGDTMCTDNPWGAVINITDPGSLLAQSDGEWCRWLDAVQVTVRGSGED